MNVVHSFWRSGLILMASGAFLITSCRKAEEIAPAAPAVISTTAVTGAVTDTEINNWILENMKFWYYWNDKLPASPNASQKPGLFFDSILNKFNATTNPTGDRFSWIQESATELKASLSGEQTTTGMEFKLFLREAGSSDIIAKVLYVQHNSPASKAGVKRGDIINAVNGTKLTNANYRELIFGEGNTKTYGFATIENSKIVDANVTKTITAEVYQANPVYLDSVYTIQGKKVGYLVYNQFVPGPNNSKSAAYDQQLRTVFGKFKAQGISELVLDLRYNPGGYVSSSTVLGSLIGRGIDNSKLFYKKEYNKTLTTEYQAYDNKNKTDSFNGFFANEANNVGGNLQRLFVLTTSSSASASELLINGLRPYMEVVTLGSTSYGKNVGSITITDNKGRIKWGMQPIVSKTFNAQNVSDYSTGFTPKVEVKEFTNVVWKPLGDISDALLNEAIFQITGGRTARVAARTGVETPSVGSSIERKAGGSNMFFSDKLPGQP
ncbi:MAG TPA: S41 family peptidase [Spirosoma sp.]|nr:S41 family peptidase [Spirosoma sp.]